MKSPCIASDISNIKQLINSKSEKDNVDLILPTSLSRRKIPCAIKTLATGMSNNIAIYFPGKFLLLYFFIFIFNDIIRMMDNIFEMADPNELNAAALPDKRNCRQK